MGLHLAALLQPAELRQKLLRAYLDQEGLSHIATMVLHRADDLGTVKQPINILMFEGVCCTEISNAVLRIRRPMGLKDNIELMKPVMARDGRPLSSARIRRGEIDREGRPLRGTDEPPRRLPESGRAVLATPKGELFHKRDGNVEKRVVARLQEESPPKVIAVGDVTTSTLVAQGFVPDVCVVDGMTKRGRYDVRVPGAPKFVVYNPAASIFPESWSVMDTALHSDSKCVILVEGEEDLLGFPAVILAPTGSVMLYGQPDAGIVYVPVSPENKSIARSLLDSMDVIT
ncbi:MAG: DUF359 domain-containing protein [Candidatus Thorarchaeota archaeon]